MAHGVEAPQDTDWLALQYFSRIEDCLSGQDRRLQDLVVDLFSQLVSVRRNESRKGLAMCDPC